MASFVSARLLNGFLRSLAVQHIDVDALVGDLPIEWGEGPRRTSLVAWDDVAELGARLERGLGGGEALEDLGAAIASSRPMPAIRRLAGFTASPSALYRIALRWLELHMPHDLTTSVEAHDDGRLEVQVVMPPASRSCRPLFQMLAGAARALPRQIDLPEAVVEGRIDSRAATFVVTPPGSGTILRRAARSIRTLLGSNEAIEELEEERHLLRRHVDQLERALFDATVRESTLRTLVSASDELLLLVGHDGRIHAASDSSSRLTGYDPEQIVGSHLTLWFHRDDDPRVRGLLDSAFAGGELGPERCFRTRHEAGDWLEAAVEVRGSIRDDTGSHVVLAVLPRVGARGEASRDELAARLRSLEQRYGELRETYEKLLETERLAPTAAIGEPIESVSQSLSRPMSTPSARSFSSRRS